MAGVYPDVIVESFQFLEGVEEHDGELLCGETSFDGKIGSSDFVEEERVPSEDDIPTPTVVKDRQAAAFLSVTGSVPALESDLA